MVFFKKKENVIEDENSIEKENIIEDDLAVDDECTANEEEKENGKKEKSWKKIICENLIVILIGLVLGLCAMAFAQPVKVMGHSMENTLHNGDYMLMSRVSYLNKTPSFGDVVVTKSDLENGQKKLIKRVIGLPGDKIVIKEGKVFRNGKLLNESYIKEQMNPTEFVTEVVPDGQVFVMGDNRNDSLDSRSPSVGTLSINKDIIGKCYVDVSQFKKV